MAMEIPPDRGQSDFDRNFLFALGVKALAANSKAILPLIKRE